MPSHPIAALALAAVSVTSAVEAQSLARWFVDGQRGADIASNGRTKTAPWKTIAYALSRIPPVTNPRNWQTLEVCGRSGLLTLHQRRDAAITPTYNLFLEGTLNNAPPVIRIPSGGVGLRFSPAISYSRNPSTVRYLRFEGGDYGIEIGASTTHRHRPRVQDCIFSGQAKAGVRVRDSQGGTDPRFFQNEFMNGPVGIEVDGSYRGGVIAPDIDECFFHDLSMAGITVRDANSGSFEPPINACRFWNSPIGVDIETSGSTFDQTTIKVSRSTFHTMSRHGVRLNAAKLGNGRLEILDSSFHRSGTAIALTGPRSDTTTRIGCR